MGWLKEESAYERRMRELEEESERIRKNMQALSKSTVREPSTRPAASNGPRTRSSALPPQAYNTVEIEADVVSDSHDEDDAEDTRTLGYGGDYNRSESAQPQKNLAHYLASGSFGKAGSLSRERRILRNKAIFMAIMAIIAIFSLLQWLK